MPGFEVLSAALVGGEWELLVQTELDLVGCPTCGAVATTAGRLGVGWHTIMREVKRRGTPLIDNPKRLAAVSAVGVDETAFLRATGTHPTMYVTGVADLTAGRPARLLDVVQGRSGTVLGAWLKAQDTSWRQQIRTASLDPFRGYATALAAQLPDAVRVLDPFHVVKLGLTCVDVVRRRVQQETLGHRGHTQDPLFRRRRLLRRRVDRLSPEQVTKLETALDAGDPNGEVTAAWLIAQQLMAGYARRNRTLIENAIVAAKTCPVPEARRLGRTLTAWRTELFARFDHPEVSNGPHREPEPESQEHQASRERVPQFRQLPAPATSQPRPHPPRSNGDPDQNPPTQDCGVEPVCLVLGLVSGRCCLWASPSGH
jgi:transposase